MDNKKGEDILLLDVQNVTYFTDYFIFCSNSSDRMIDALSKYVREEVKKKYELIANPEGEGSNGWVLIDFGDVIVNFFLPEKRAYYQLEDLWSEGRVLVKIQ